jgi:hypothetical protein
MDGNIDLKCDVSADDYEKRENVDKIWPKSNKGLDSSKTIEFF